MKDYSEAVNAIAEEARAHLTTKHQAREQALQLSREAIRHSANAIRAIHRNEFEEAQRLIAAVRAVLAQGQQVLRDHADLYFTGFVQDAQKEYAEAQATYAFITGGPLPSPQQLQVEVPPYLNGLGEAVGELRRYVLDSLRRDDDSRCEELMDDMDQVYTVLVTMDFPDALTGGLRRTTDMVRGVLEKTRGDLTMALRQRRLEQRLASLEETR